ncbi:fluoride efflux transporter CrcB [Clostridium perfringens]|nr:fluoride efflux transporter CrcB [Clostridium perfringens]
MQKLLLALIVGCGGFLGAALRYLISIFAAKNLGANFPYGTLIANILGALLIGFIMEFSMDSALISPNMKLFLTTGIMGGLTPFSTFSYETVSMLNNGHMILGIENVILNLGCSLVFVVIGQKFAKILF